jgi:DNA-binding PadR family transcriptional regulator
MQLVKRQWLLQDGEDCSQPKFAITEKGRAFLEKWLELQQIAGLDNKTKLKIQAVKASGRIVE